MIYHVTYAIQSKHSCWQFYKMYRQFKKFSDAVEFAKEISNGICKENQACIKIYRSDLMVDDISNF